MPPAIAAEIARLAGHSVALAPDHSAYVIVDVAGEGRPLVGVVERRGVELWLAPTDADLGRLDMRLTGPLAVPRIAGPGYKVWVLGRMDRGGALRVKRLGVLARPRLSSIEDARTSTRCPRCR